MVRFFFLQRQVKCLSVFNLPCYVATWLKNLTWSIKELDKPRPARDYKLWMKWQGNLKGLEEAFLSWFSNIHTLIVYLQCVVSSFRVWSGSICHSLTCTALICNICAVERDRGLYFRCLFDENLPQSQWVNGCRAKCLHIQSVRWLCYVVLCFLIMSSSWEFCFRYMVSILTSISPPLFACPQRKKLIY